MKLFHLGDLHIGKLVNGFYMDDDQQFVLNQLYDVIKEEKPDVILIAGDIFDRSVPTLQAVELLNDALGKIVFELKTPVIAIAGNHDSNGRIEYLSQFAKHTGLHIVGTLKEKMDKIVLQDEFGEVVIYPIPYTPPAVVRDFFQDETIKNHDDAMKKMIEYITGDLDEAKRNVAIAHGHVCHIKEGIPQDLEESESEKPLSIGGTEVVNATWFDKFHYTALGHLHGPQKVGTDKIRYSGSLLKYSFSEVNQKKGITIVNMGKEGEVVIRFREFIPRRDLRVVKGELSNIIKKSNLDLRNKEDYIRVELEDMGELIDPMAKLRSVYPHVMELTRTNREKTRSSSKAAVANVKEKDNLKLFEKFYEDIMGEKCEKAAMEVIKLMIEEAEKDGEV